MSVEYGPATWSPVSLDRNFSVFDHNSSQNLTLFVKPRQIANQAACLAFGSYMWSGKVLKNEKFEKPRCLGPKKAQVVNVIYVRTTFSTRCGNRFVKNGARSKLKSNFQLEFLWSGAFIVTRGQSNTVLVIREPFWLPRLYIAAHIAENWSTSSKFREPRGFHFILVGGAILINQFYITE